MTSDAFLCFFSCDNRRGDVELAGGDRGAGVRYVELPLWSRRLMHVSVFCLELGRSDV